MFSRIRYFFEDVGYWFSDRLRFRRRRGDTPDESSEAPATAPKQRRRRLRRKGKKAAAAGDAGPGEAGTAAGEADLAAAVAAATEAKGGTGTDAPSGDPSAAETAQLPAATATKRRRPRLRRRSQTPKPPKAPKPPRRGPRLPRPSRPSRRALLIGGAIVLVAAAVVGVYLATGFDFGGDDEEQAPAPEIVIEEGRAPEEASELGFPAFATKNTTRVAGAGPVADAAGVSLATSPATGGVEGPPAVSLVAEEDWPSSIAAASLVADPVGAPILLSGPDEVPDLTLSALTALAPQGSPDTGDAQLFNFGDALPPEGLRTRDVEGTNPAEIAAAAAALREELTDEPPAHVVLASSDRPEFAMPAAAWSARSGDPVLFVQSESVPTPTLEALEELKNVPIYILGPEPVISDAVADQIEEATGEEPTRIGEDDAVSNSIAFARYSDGTFGWNITDPGHGVVIANATRPADAGAAAPLSASGKWGPLLLTDNANVLPAPIEGYLLDIKPGYVDDPTRAVYNHAWLMGNSDAISVEVQAEIDELLELAKVQSGRGNDTLGAIPGQPEPEAEPRPDDDQ